MPRSPARRRAVVHVDRRDVLAVEVHGSAVERRYRKEVELDRRNDSSDALAAPKAQVNGKHMAQKRCQAGHRAQQQGRLAEPLGNAVGGQDRQRSLGKIEPEDQDTEAPAQHSADVGRADVAAAGVEQIDAARPGDEPAEWDGPQKIGGEQG